MAATATEREIKLDVTDDWPMPDLTGVPGVAAVTDAGEHRLVATYLDTADHRLLAARATFRRRIGGHDAGWHVKLPGELSGDRIEVRNAHRRPPLAPPAELVDLVAARTRGADLVPVMELVTVRHLWHLVGPDGRVLVEVADDRVVATRPDGVSEPWREVEAELVDGDPALLDAVAALLRKAGAAPAAGPSKLGRALGAVPPARAAVRRPRSAPGLVLGYLRAQVDALVDADTRVRLDRPESVHDLRVATRRLRSTLATHRRLLDPASADHLRAELKAVAGAAADARDAEVLAERLTAEVAALPADLRTAALDRRVADDLAADLDTAKAGLRAALAEPRYLALLGALSSLVAGRSLPAPPDGPSPRKPRGKRSSVRHEVRRLRRAMRAADARRDTEELPAALHDVRKATKRARYAAELIVPGVGGRAADLAERLSGLQDLLGLHQDDVVAREKVRELAAAAHAAGEDTFAFGVLHEAVPADHEAVRRAARRAVRRAGRTRLS